MRRYLLLALLLAMFLAPSCAPGFEPASKVTTLRVISVIADKPYAAPGDDVTLSMTVYDANDEGPRPLQIVWIAGCFDPAGDQFFLCFEQLLEVLGPLASGGTPDSEFVKVDVGLPASSGGPNVHEFTFSLPEDIITRRPVPDEGPHYGIAYVFFAACAGTLAPAPLVSLGGEVPEFPVQCLDSAGNRLGPESFVPGYTQVYSFADQRPNANPEVTGITLDGVEIADTSTSADLPAVAACPVSEDERRRFQCGGGSPTDNCTKYTISGTVGDVAEVDPDGFDAEGVALRETVWVNYFADAGDIERSIALVSDAKTGYLAEHGTVWVPPDAPSGTIVSIWAVVRDHRGGSTVARRFVRIE